MELLDGLGFWNANELKVLKFLLTNTKIALGKSMKTVTRGLPQGSKHSPLLFILYMAEIWEEIKHRLKESHLNADGTLYVDDIGIVCMNNQVKEIYKIIRQTMSEAGMTLGVKANGTKSAVMVYKSRYGK